MVGASDHTVTHSLYIEDPDGNEISALRGRPRRRLEEPPGIVGLPHQATAYSDAPNRPDQGVLALGILDRAAPNWSIKEHVCCTGSRFVETNAETFGRPPTGVGHVDRSQVEVPAESCSTPTGGSCTSSATPRSSAAGWAFSNFAVSFTIISILSGCLTAYTIAMTNGGPVDMTWG